jgi:hypothetical protein
LAIATVESSRGRTCIGYRCDISNQAVIDPLAHRDSSATIRHNRRMRDDDIIRRIERYRFPRAPVIAEWRNRGYTLLHAETAAPIARLRPLRGDGQMEILYWSWKQRWAPVGPFGGTAAPLDEALDIIAHEPIFWAGP